MLLYVMAHFLTLRCYRDFQIQERTLLNSFFSLRFLSILVQGPFTTSLGRRPSSGCSLGVQDDLSGHSPSFLARIIFFWPFGSDLVFRIALFTRTILPVASHSLVIRPIVGVMDSGTSKNIKNVAESPLVSNNTGTKRTPDGKRSTSSTSGIGECTLAMASLSTGNLPIYVQPNTVNSASMNTFIPVTGPAGFMGSMFASMHDSFHTNHQPTYEWQVDPVTGYLSGLYSGGVLSGQSASLPHQPISVGQAATYQAAVYGLPPGSQSSPKLAAWTGTFVHGDRKPQWNSSPTHKFKYNISTYGGRKFSKPAGFHNARASDVSATSDSTTGLTAANETDTGTESLQSSPRSTITQSSDESGSSFAKPFGPAVSMDVLAKLAAGNTIPAPVPSLFAGPSLEDALEQSLYNPNQTTNVYIRGLPPDTTDSKLLEICERFGEITSSKAILEMQSNTCKGFGFACFQHESDAKACIAGLLHCGYQVSFAKESFSTRLKNLQDPQSTNLYLSNLPPDMHEKALEELFQPYKVISNRILRDSNNVSRGVGFARLSDRQSAEAIIEKFDNKVLDTEDKSLPLQVRFADSPSQKRLKGQTQRRRQWRAREYNLLTGHISYMDLSSGGDGHLGADPSGLYMHFPVASLPYQYHDSVKEPSREEPDSDQAGNNITDTSQAQCQANHKLAHAESLNEGQHFFDPGC